MQKSCLTLLIAAAAFATLTTQGPQVGAVSFFRDQFKVRYLKEDPRTDGERALVEAVSETKCYVCHATGTDAEGKKYSKKVHNIYGVALAKLLDKDDFKSDRRKAEPEKVAAEVQAAMEKVEAMKVNPDDADSPTFGELFKQGKLPSPDAMLKE